MCLLKTYYWYRWKFMEERGLVFFLNLSNGTVSRTNYNDMVHRVMMDRFPSTIMQTIGLKSD